MLALDFQSDDAEIIIPAALGTLLEPYLLLEVESVDSTSLQMFGAMGQIADGERQELCDATLLLAEPDFAGSPHFELTSPVTTLPAAGTHFKIHDVVISGTFGSDGSSWGGSILQGQVGLPSYRFPSGRLRLGRFYDLYPRRLRWRCLL